MSDPRRFVEHSAERGLSELLAEDPEQQMDFVPEPQLGFEPEPDLVPEQLPGFVPELLLGFVAVV